MLSGCLRGVCDCCEHDPEKIAAAQERREARDREFAEFVARMPAKPCSNCAELQARIEQLEAELSARNA